MRMNEAVKGLLLRKLQRAVIWSLALPIVFGVWSSAIARDKHPNRKPGTVERNWAQPAVAFFHRRLHYVGEVWASFGNDGSWGANHGDGICLEDEAVLRIHWCPSFEYPGGSRIDYLWNGGLWVGGLVGPDTLVSEGYGGWDGPGDEFSGFARMESGLPDGYTVGCDEIGRERSLEQTYWSVYSDTTRPLQSADQHRAMGLEVLQVTHASSDDVARDFVFVDLIVKNIGHYDIRDLYLGFFMDCDVHAFHESGTPYEDDISGFLPTWPNALDPTFDDTLNIAWSADNDGDPNGEKFPLNSARGAIGWRLLRHPPGTGFSYNWWTSNPQANRDWGPRHATDLRVLGHGGRGTPSGDLNKYYYMSNGEIDYSQYYSAVDFSDQGWAPPLRGGDACNLADGLDTRSLMAVGPVEEFGPGKTARYTFAVIGSKGLHQFPDNVFDCSEPDKFVAALDFSDLAKNAWWAGFIFDNFGVDTDNDGYAGEFYEPVTGFDTVYYTGDGCPDFSGPKPPIGPGASNLILSSRPLELEITWTGANSETTVDPLTRQIDFEGYKLYVAERNSPSDRPSADDYSLLASWDIINFRRYTYEPRSDVWEVSSDPLTVEKWQELYKDNQCDNSDEPFDPRKYLHPSTDSAYCYNETDQFGQTIKRLAYFAPQDFNQGDTIMTGDRKTPNLIQRIATLDTTIGDKSFQYGVYRAILKDLLPAKHYFVSVTAFDFGDPENNLDPLETTPGVSRVDGIPIYSADVVESYWNQGGARKDSIRVVVYPNPYKSSFIGTGGRRTSYAEQGFEGSFGEELETITDEDRRVHFINMPDTATIRIYSLDGDLIRELNHPDPILSSYSSKISWDLVSRNTQAVESGIYIYRVDARQGSQIGKLVIIK